jgi:hypothetical protein
MDTQFSSVAHFKESIGNKVGKDLGHFVTISQDCRRSADHFGHDFNPLQPGLLFKTGNDLADNILDMYAGRKQLDQDIIDPFDLVDDLARIGDHLFVMTDPGAQYLGKQSD